MQDATQSQLQRWESYDFRYKCDKRIYSNNKQTKMRKITLSGFLYTNIVLKSNVDFFAFYKKTLKTELA